LVTYGNNAKQDLLEVPEELIERYGAVSREVAIAMADGAQRRASAAIALAVTGVAGPGGGTAEKPVGTVWFAWSVAGHGATTAVNRFDGDRQAVRQQTVLAALTGALERIRTL
jgi:nicotinamide-nucleotide amidase